MDKPTITMINHQNRKLNIIGKSAQSKQNYNAGNENTYLHSEQFQGNKSYLQ